LAVLEPATGWPQSTRIALATDVDGTPLLLVSDLSAHTQALKADGRCALLLGEPGKGDPLAHPRITLMGRAVQVQADDPAHARVRRRYLARLPKASLYVDFGDFSFWRIEPERASLNGGFGKAFELHAQDVLSPCPDLAAFDRLDLSACEHMNQDHAPAVQAMAQALTKGAGGDWELVTLDAHGGECRGADGLVRLEFDQPVHTAQALQSALVALARQARDQRPEA
jgi:putative heme iron utilization protein